MGTSAGKRIAAALCLCLAGTAVAALLLLQHHGEPWAVAAVSQACGEGGTSGCTQVARSAWSSFAGFPVAGFGVVFYLSLSLLLALTLLAPGDVRDAFAGLAVAGLAAGLVVDLLLLGLQAFVIHAYCALCITTYLLSAGALFALLPARFGARGLGPALGRIEGRLGGAGWALGTLALAGFAFASEKTLDYREARRQATLLGTPAGSALARDATYWQERAKELQATIDDPRKLEAYFSAKAQREYDAAAVEKLDLASLPLKGPANAPVKVVEFSDFLCPFCRNLAMALSQFVPQAGGRVAVYFKSFPLDKNCNAKLPGSTHPGACFVALGGVCADGQGKLEAYHDRVFATELHNPTAADVVRLAGEAGLNAAAMQSCLDDPKTKEALAAQVAEGNRLGVNATPTLFINGKKLPRINDFVAVVDKEARKKGFPPLAQP